MRNRFALIAASSLFAAASTSASAAVVVSEDFNYGGTAGSLSGQNGGTGFSTAWNGGTYTPTGLTFSNLSSSGGAWAGNAGVGGQRVFTTAFAMAGPIYGSFLFNSTAATGGVVQQVGIGNSGATNNQNSAMRFSPNSDGVAGARNATVTVQGGTEGAMTPSGYASGTTYLYLFHYQNSSATSWVLDAAQYNNFNAAPGGIQESDLNAAAVGTGPTNVTGRATSTGTVTQALTQMNIYGFGGGPTTFDRIQFSGTGISDVASPEPGSLGLLGVGAVGLLARRRRQARD